MTSLLAGMEHPCYAPGVAAYHPEMNAPASRLQRMTGADYQREGTSNGS